MFSDALIYNNWYATFISSEVPRKGYVICYYNTTVGTLRVCRREERNDVGVPQQPHSWVEI